ARPPAAAAAGGAAPTSPDRTGPHRPLLPLARRGSGYAPSTTRCRAAGLRPGETASAWRSGRAKREPAMRLSAPLDHLQRRLAQAWRERAVTLKAARFALVGVGNTLVDYGVFLAGYYLLGPPLIPANLPAPPGPGSRSFLL